MRILILLLISSITWGQNKGIFYYPTPLQQASNIVITSPTSTTLTVTWTAGSGSSRIVLAKANTPVDAIPVNGQVYSESLVFGSGSQIGTGNYVVKTGSGPVTITGLSTGTIYYFAVFESNPGGYLTSFPATGKETTIIDFTSLSGLQFYYNASLESGKSDGDKINMTDFSGNGNNTSQPSTAFRATYKANFLNGKAVFGLADVGQDQYTPATGTQFMHKGACTIYMLVYTTVGSKVIYDSNSGNLTHTGRTIGGFSNNSLQDITSNGSGTEVIKVTTDDQASPLNQWNVVVLKSDPTKIIDNSEVSVNGVLKGVKDLVATNQPYSSSASTDTPYWFTNQSGSSVFRGYVALIAAYNTVHSDAIERAIVSNIKNSYGLSIPLKPFFENTTKTIALFDSARVRQTTPGGLDYIAFPTAALNPVTGEMWICYQDGSTHNATQDQRGIIQKYLGNKTFGPPIVVKDADPGAWVNTKNYIQYDLVSFGGSTWQAKTSSTGVTPVEGSSWTAFPFEYSGFCIGFDSGGRMYIGFAAVQAGIKLPARLPYVIYTDNSNPSSSADFSAPIVMTYDYTGGMAQMASPYYEYNGALYATFYATNSSAREGVIYRSSDRGLTWSFYSRVYPSLNADGEEPNVEIRADGVWINKTRFDPTETTTFGIPARGSRTKYSLDNGLTWSCFFGYFPAEAQNPIVFFPDGNQVSITRTVVTVSTPGYAEIVTSYDGSKTMNANVFDMRGFCYAGGVYYKPEDMVVMVYFSETVGSNSAGPNEARVVRFKSQ